MNKKKDIVFSLLPDGEGVLLNLNTKKFYTLNSTAAEIWKHYEMGKKEDEIAEHLNSTYEIGIDEAKTSVIKFFEELKKYKLI
jgi:Ser/Thr protein kinase RdoA (MazF antagonist)